MHPASEPRAAPRGALPRSTSRREPLRPRAALRTPVSVKDQGHISATTRLGWSPRRSSMHCIIRTGRSFQVSDSRRERSGSAPRRRGRPKRSERMNFGVISYDPRLPEHAASVREGRRHLHRRRPRHSSLPAAPTPSSKAGRAKHVPGGGLPARVRLSRPTSRRTRPVPLGSARITKHHTFLHAKNVEDLMQGFRYHAIRWECSSALSAALEFDLLSRGLAGPTSGRSGTDRVVRPTAEGADDRRLVVPAQLRTPVRLPRTTSVSCPTSSRSCSDRRAEVRLRAGSRAGARVPVRSPRRPRANCCTTRCAHRFEKIRSRSAASRLAAALYGPLHGGANEAVLRMLTEVGDVTTPDIYLPRQGRRMPIDGLRSPVYKNYDLRAKVIKQVADEVFEVTGRNPLLHRARARGIALRDEYFVSRKLYPNVDFYSGHHLPGDAACRWRCSR